MRCPPCAGMTQIRFDGRRLRTFLSARLTGLPCSTTEYTLAGVPPTGSGDRRRTDERSMRPAPTGASSAGSGFRRRDQCFRARMIALSALPVTQMKRRRHEHEPDEVRFEPHLALLPTYAPSGMEIPPPPPPLPWPCSSRDPVPLLAVPASRRSCRHRRRTRSSRVRRGSPWCRRCRPVPRTTSSLRRPRRSAASSSTSSAMRATLLADAAGYHPHPAAAAAASSSSGSVRGRSPRRSPARVDERGRPHGPLPNLAVTSSIVRSASRHSSSGSHSIAPVPETRRCSARTPMSRTRCPVADELGRARRMPRRRSCARHPWARPACATA